MIRQLLISTLAITSLVGSAMTAKVDGFDFSRKQNEVVTSFLGLPKASVKQHAARAAEQTKPAEPITELPADASIKEYSRFSLGYGIGSWGLTDMTDQGFASQIAFCENGDVYIKNPTSAVITDSYIKGHLEGNKIRFEFPQTVSKEYDEMTETWVYVQACAMDAVYDEPEYSKPMADGEGEAESFGMPSDYVESDVQILEMECLEDGMIQLHLAENKALGYRFVWDESLVGIGEQPLWVGISDYCIEYKPFTDKLLELPAGAKTEKWRFLHEGTGALLNVAFVGDEVYFQGLDVDLPEAWVKGTVGDGVISFKSGQYLGLQESDNHYVYFIGARSEVVYDPEFDEEMTVIVGLESFDFKYDAEAKFIDFDGNFIVFNGGLGSFYFLGTALFGTISYQGDAVMAEPASPVITEFVTDLAEYGQYGLIVTMSPLDVNGNMFNTGDLYYKVFINGSEEPFVFTAGSYSSIDADMTDVPFAFSDDYDFIVYDETRMVTVYTTEQIDKIGVQLVRNDNGNILKSEIAEYEVASVNDLTTSKEIQAVEYIDLSGRRVVNPDKGVYIKMIRYTDGSMQTVKELR